MSEPLTGIRIVIAEDHDDTRYIVRRNHLIVAESRQRLSGADCRPRWTE